MLDIWYTTLDASKFYRIFTLCLLYVNCLTLYFIKYFMNSLMQISVLSIPAVCSAYTFKWNWKVYEVSALIIVFLPLNSCRDITFSLDLNE
jgi:hypothetical protein